MIKHLMEGTAEIVWNIVHPLTWARTRKERKFHRKRLSDLQKHMQVDPVMGQSTRAMSRRKLLPALLIAAGVSAPVVSAAVAHADVDTVARGLALADRFRTPSPMMFGARGDGVTDDTAAITAALAHCLTYNLPLYLYGKFYSCSDVQIPNKAEVWYIIGSGGGFVNPATSTTSSCCLFSTALNAPGGTTKPYNYTSGVVLDDVTFKGSGYGVGYKHAVQGHLTNLNCKTKGLEVGFKLLGCSGYTSWNLRSENCNNAEWFALLADDPVTVNYTAEGAGWNDGCHIFGGSRASSIIAVRHDGSTSEGVLHIYGGFYVAASDAFVQTQGRMTSVGVHDIWCEYLSGANADMLRFLNDPVGLTTSPCTILVENCHLYHSVGYTIRYFIYNLNRDINIRDNYFTAGVSGTYPTPSFTAVIRHSNTATRLPYDTPFKTITPTDTSNFTAGGILKIAETDVSDIGGYSGVYYMKNNGVTYLLTYKSGSRVDTGGGVYVSEYYVHTFSWVYSAQFPNYATGWVNDDVKGAAYPRHIAVDLDNPTLGLTFSGSTCTIDPGINGGITSKGICRISGGAFGPNISRSKFYSHGGGYVYMENVGRG